MPTAIAAKPKAGNTNNCHGGNRKLVIGGWL